MGFVRTIILARLLAPSDFGLLGIAMLSITILETFSQTGFQSALIQKKKEAEEYLDTAWTALAIRGFILCGILFLAAPLIAGFFKSPAAVWVIRAIAASTLLVGFRNIGIIYFRKDLDFKKEFAFDFSGTVVDVAVSVVLALVLRNVWALVIGGLLGNVVRLAVSYMIHPYRPKLILDGARFKTLFGFGKWILGSTVLVFLVTQGDDILLGRLLGVTALGVYQMAYLISNLPATEITHIVSQVMFPAYSKLQDDAEALKTAFLMTITAVSFISIPLSIAIFLLIPEFTYVFLGAKWEAIIAPSRILAIAGGIRSVSAIWGSIYVAKGIPAVAFRKNILRFIVTFAPIYFLTMEYGISGTSIAVLAGIIVSITYDFLFTAFKSGMGIKISELIRIISIQIIASIPPAGFVCWVKYSGIHFNLLVFLATAVAAVLVYLMAVALIQKLFKPYPLDKIKEMMRNRHERPD